jgi:hypothetical protein
VTCQKPVKPCFAYQHKDQNQKHAGKPNEGKNNVKNHIPDKKRVMLSADLRCSENI